MVTACKYSTDGSVAICVENVIMYILVTDIHMLLLKTSPNQIPTVIE